MQSLLDDKLPVTIWCRDAFHLRIRDGRALLNWAVETPHVDPYALDIDQALVDRVWALVLAFVPAMRETSLDVTDLHLERFAEGRTLPLNGMLQRTATQTCANARAVTMPMLP